MGEFSQYIKHELDANEAKAIEMNAYAIGVSPDVLMENAGSALAREAKERFPKKRRILVVCGSGNNAGDGFAAARILSKNKEVYVAMLFGKNNVKPGPSSKNLDRLVRSNVTITLVGNSAQKLKAQLSQSDLVLDCILGMGSHGEPKGTVANAIHAINASGKPVISADIPSGINTATGSCKHAVNADCTVTFHRAKSFMDASRRAGKIVVADIGIPERAELFAGPGDIYLASTPRDAKSDKRTNGRVLVIGGSKDFHGAPALAYSASYAMLAALRSGAGYVSAFVPESAVLANRRVSPNVIVRAFSGDALSERDVEPISKAVAHFDSVVIGPGLGRDEESLSAANNIIRATQKLGKSLVIDADAITAIKSQRLKGTAVITPNRREFEPVWGSLPRSTQGIAKRVLQAAQGTGACVLLKGHTTIVSDGHAIKMIQSGSAALGTMGTGDVLSGMIAGFAAENHNIFRSAIAGAYLHSAIGDTLHRKIGDRILATDVIKNIPHMADALMKFRAR